MERKPPFNGHSEMRWSETIQKSWEEGVLYESCLYACEVLESKLREFSFPPLDFEEKRSRERKILSDFYNLERRLEEHRGQLIPPPGDYVAQKTPYLKELAKEIREKRRFYLVNNVCNLSRSITDIPELSKTLLNLDALALYLLICQPNRFLVGLKGSVFWKNIQWPPPVNGEGMLLFDGAISYINNLMNIGGRELITVPERIIHPDLLKSIRVPRPARTIDELLEDAYYRQRYIVPLEGAEVRFRRAGDLQKMIIVQTGKMVFAKAVVHQGEAFVWINIDTAEGGGIDDYFPESFDRKTDESLWATILSEVYHDLVTAIEKPRKKGRGKGGLGGLDDGIEIGGRFGIIYIPRVVRVGEKPLPPYEGPPRPVTPHRVIGYRKRGNLSENHRRELLKFEGKYGISILNNLPGGYTFIRPHISPKDSEINLEDLPTFIKRRIETRLAQQLQRPVS